MFEDVASGRRLNGRVGLDAAITAVESGACGALVVAKLDRLSRSLSEFASLMDRAQKGAWAIVALDVGIDTTTPNGEMIAGMFAVLAQWERRVIGQRTRDALESRRVQGVRLGRPPTHIAAQLRDQIVGLHEQGRTLRDIARLLNNAGYQSPAGGRWHASSVRRVVLGAREAESTPGIAHAAIDEDAHGSDPPA